jgi:predicted transcriptional regulator
MSQLAPDAPKTEFIGTHVDELTRAELVALARDQDRSVSWLLRDALARYLERSESAEEES